MEENKSIGFVSFEIGVHNGFERVRSAHIQYPLKVLEIAKSLGWDTVLYTNDLREDTSLPVELSHENVRFVPDPRKRKNTTVMYSGFSKRIDVISIVKGIYCLQRECKKNNLNVLYFTSGTLAVGIYAAVLGHITTDTKIIWTPSATVGRVSKALKYFLSGLSGLVVNTEFIASQYGQLHNDIRVIRHGVTRRFKTDTKLKNRVTFWRDPSFENGADIALEVFTKLSSLFPDISFTFMVRPHFNEIDLYNEIDNVVVYKFPYQEGVTLESVLSETMVCIFPFRELSTNPQLAILESLASGIPCICNDIESVSEYGVDKSLLIQNNSVDEYVEVLTQFLRTPENFNLSKPGNFGFSWQDFTNNFQKYIDDTLR
jgi:glycosyltransferase involved in cell wall biosynthesis